MFNFLKLPHARLGPVQDPAALSEIHKKIIQTKPFLKQLYVDFYNSMGSHLPTVAGEGVWVEVGSGGGFSKEVIRELLTSDIVFHKDLDLLYSATALPFREESVDGILMLNVFHHIPDVKKFLHQVSACLQPGGRLVMIEPANTLFSRRIYKRIHHESFDEHGDWYVPGDNPLFSANGALPWIVFSRDYQRFMQEFPSLKRILIKAHTPFRYLLSGGLSYCQFLPAWTYHLVKSVERLLFWLNPSIGMFVTIVVEKVA